MRTVIIPGNPYEDENRLPPKMTAQYRRFIDRLPQGEYGHLRFDANEDMALGITALLC